MMTMMMPRGAMAMTEIVAVFHTMGTLIAVTMVEIPGLGRHRKGECGDECDCEQVFGEHLNLLDKW